MNFGKLIRLLTCPLLLVGSVWQGMQTVDWQLLNVLAAGGDSNSRATSPSPALLNLDRL